MASKYFTVEKLMPIAASVQHAAAFSDGDLVVDWQEIEIPKGASLLRSIVVLIRPKGDAGPTLNDKQFELFISKTNTVSLGTVNSAVDNRPNNDIIGMAAFDAASGSEEDAILSTFVAQMGTDVGNPTTPLVIQGDVTSGSNVGFDKIYVAMIAQGAFDFRSINAVNETSFSAGTQTVITMDGTGMDVREHFAAGDILHAQDDAVLGTLASADTATQLTLTAANTDAIAENDVIYNLHPIKLILGFER